MTEEEFLENRKKWKELMFSGKFEEAGAMYWDRLFPAIQDKFIERTMQAANSEKLPAYDCLVIPGGLFDSYYILLINALKPKFVYFLFTKEGEEGFLDRIIEKTGLKRSEYTVDIIEYDRMDITDVYGSIKNKLSLFEGKNVALDLTRGKRVMSVGAGITGAFFGFDLVYVDEEWIDEIKRGLPGTERLVRVKNPFEVFGDIKQMQSIMLFNRHDFGAALTLFSELCQKVIDPREFEIKVAISEAYNHWDGFNYTAAHHKLELALKKINQYNYSGIDTKKLSENLETLSILKKRNDLDAKEFFSRNNLVLHLVIDFYLNAKRRSELQRHEDAVARLYRSIEIISQNRLSDYGIDTKDPDFTVIPGLDGKYRQITEKLYGKAKCLPDEIGIKHGHILLYALQDDLWKGSEISDLEKFLGPIRMRDNSIIAHGKELIGIKAYENFERFTRKFIIKLCNLYDQKFENLIKQHKFIKLE